MNWIGYKQLLMTVSFISLPVLLLGCWSFSSPKEYYHRTTRNLAGLAITWLAMGPLCKLLGLLNMNQAWALVWVGLACGSLAIWFGRAGFGSDGGDGGGGDDPPEDEPPFPPGLDVDWGSFDYYRRSWGKPKRKPSLKD